MSRKRTVIRRVIELWALSASIVFAAISGGVAQMVAESTPIVTKAIEYKRVPIATEQLLALVPYFKSIGFISALILAVAAVLVFKLSKDEDTRLQATLVISVFGFGIAVWFWMSVCISLVLLPHGFNQI